MAKQSMIQREKKRIRLERKYALKRLGLLARYRDEKNFVRKMALHSKIQIYKFNVVIY